MMRALVHFSPQSSPRGFTMVEMIVVIVITAIIAAVVAVFIRSPVQGYVDSIARAELTDVADIAVRRLARDLRLALPNSVRVNGGTYIEFLLTRTGGRYLDAEDRAAGNILNFSNAIATSFDVVGVMSTGQQAIVKDDQIVVYNLGPGMSPADAYDCSVSCNRAKVSANPVGNTIQLDSNPFAVQTPFVMPSPSHRFQVVITPVTYVCSGGTLRRYWNYPIAAAQPTTIAALTSPDTQSALLAEGLTACNFDYVTQANVRSALVGVTLTVEKGNSGKITLFHQVHVDNTP